VHPPAHRAQPTSRRRPGRSSSWTSPC
jgi:hypothetical protein